MPNLLLFQIYIFKIITENFASFHQVMKLKHNQHRNIKSVTAILLVPKVMRSILIPNYSMDYNITVKKIKIALIYKTIIFRTSFDGA